MLKKFLFFFFILGILDVLKDIYIFHVEYTPREIIATLLVSIAGAIVLTWFMRDKEKRKKQKNNGTLENPKVDSESKS